MQTVIPEPHPEEYTVEVTMDVDMVYYQYRTYGIIDDDLEDSAYLHGDAYTFSDVIENINTTKTYMWLKDTEGEAKYLEGVDTIVWL